MSEVTINLEYPLWTASGEVSTLTLRRPKVLDLILSEKKSKGSEEQKAVALISSLAMLSADEVMELDMGTDFVTVSGTIKEFMDNGDYTVDKTKAKNREHTIDLKYPFSFQGKEVNRITVRRPKLKDYNEADGKPDEISKTLCLLSKVSGLSEDVLLEFELGTDFSHAKDYLLLFLGVSPS